MHTSTERWCAMEKPKWEPNDDGSHSLVLGATGFSARIHSDLVRKTGRSTQFVTFWWWVEGPNILKETCGRADSADEAIGRAEEYLKMAFERLMNEMNEVKQVMWKESN